MVYELRIKEDGKVWGDVQIHHTVSAPSNNDARTIAGRLANAAKREVRFNIEGLYQGHYIFPGEVK